MEMNTQDNRFWVATLTDGFYTVDQVKNGAKTVEPTIELADNNQWATPFVDNDPLNPWCVRANTDKIWSEY